MQERENAIAAANELAAGYQQIAKLIASDDHTPEKAKDNIEAIEMATKEFVAAYKQAMGL